MDAVLQWMLDKLLSLVLPDYASAIEVLGVALQAKQSPIKIRQIDIKRQLASIDRQKRFALAKKAESN